MKVFFVGLALLLTSCGKGSSDGGGKGSVRIDGLASDDAAEVLALNGKSTLEVAKKLGSLAEGYRDVGKFYESLDRGFKVNCASSCEIKRK